ncbi:Dienelactone hydrolase family [Pseudomonas chlororaphis subsp. aurantiaca]|nr:Dienelactone hydrolase family [Pseudomonas chlororaphis subsp. aurantiaca]
MRALFACLLLTFCAMSQAAIKTQEIPYQSPTVPGSSATTPMTTR